MFYNSLCIEESNFIPSTWYCVGLYIFADYGSPVTGEYFSEWGEYGMWLKWKSNYMFAELDEWGTGHYWFYSGNKKQGFATDTYGWGLAWPGDCYYLKKINCKSIFFPYGTDIRTLKENARNTPSLLKDKNNETLKGLKSMYCETIREDKAFQSERFSFGEPEENKEE